MVCDPGLETMRQRKVSDLHNRASFVDGDPQRGAVEHPPEQPAVLAGDPRGADLLEPAGVGGSAGPDSASRVEPGGQHPPPGQGAETDPGQHLFDEPCGRSRSAGGVRLSVQQGGSRAAPAGGLSEKLATVIAAGICDGWPERIGNESKNAVLLYGMWK